MSQKTSLFLFIVFSAGVFLVCSMYPDLFLYDRDRLQDDNEYWRLLSSHFCHLSWQHGLLNFLTFVAFLTAIHIIQPIFTMCVLTAYIVFSALLISVIFHFFFEDISYYGGFSGVLHSLFVLAAVLYLIYSPRIVGFIALAIIALKIYIEYSTGHGATGMDIPVIYEAHWIGAAVGLALVLPTIWLIRRLAR